jgi:hypothetical protein
MLIARIPCERRVRRWGEKLGAPLMLNSGPHESAPVLSRAVRVVLPKAR